MTGENLSERNCEGVMEILSAYIDGELDAEEQTLVDNHLKSCAGCREELAGLQQTSRFLSQLPELAVPRTFTLPVAYPEPSKLFRWFGSLQLASALSAALLVFVVLFDFFGQGAYQAAAPVSMSAPASSTQSAPAEASPMAATNNSASREAAAPEATTEANGAQSLAAAPAADSGAGSAVDTGTGNKRTAAVPDQTKATSAASDARTPAAAPTPGSAQQFSAADQPSGPNIWLRLAEGVLAVFVIATLTTLLFIRRQRGIQKRR